MIQAWARRLSWLALSQGAVAVLVALSALYGIGHWLWSIAPSPDYSAVAAAARQLLLARPTDLQPKPGEQFTYIGVVLSLPILIAAVVFAVRKTGLGRGGWIANSLLTVALIAAAGYLTMHSSLAEKFPLVHKDVFWIGRLSLAIALADWILFRYLPRWSIGISTFLLYEVAIVLTFSWFVYDSDGIGKSSPHFDAFFSSIVKIHNGGTCLYDVVPQYGCYGEFYNVAARVTGFSVVRTMILTALLQSLALVSIIHFAKSLIRSPAILIAGTLCMIICANRIMWGLPDNYLQYMPLRLFFPAVSLQVAAYWQSHRGNRSAAWAGLFAASSLMFNMDSGVPVFGALGALMVFSSLNRTTLRKDLPQAIRYGAIYSVSAIGGILLFFAYLSLKAGHAIHPEYLTAYQKIFYGAGFFLLPMPAEPDMWLVIGGLVTTVLTLYALRFAGRRVEPANEKAAYLAVLGIGLFSYYTGRSHVLVLLLVLWPFTILLFHLLDRAANTVKPKALIPRGLACRAVAAFIAIVAVTSVVKNQLPEAPRIMLDRWEQVLGDKVQDNTPIVISDDAAFIRSFTKPGEKVGIISTSEAALLADTGLVSALPGPGIGEILLKSDAEAIVDMLEKDGPEYLFLEQRFLLSQKILLNTAPWIKGAIPVIRKHYALVAWGPDGRLMALKKKDAGYDPAADLFNTEIVYDCITSEHCDEPTAFTATDPDTGTPLGPWKQPVHWPLAIASEGPAGDFIIRFKLQPGPLQMDYATLMSSECCAFSGMTIQHFPGTRDSYVLTVGDGEKWIQGPQFHIPASHIDTVELAYNAGRMRITINGVVAADYPMPTFISGNDGFYVGDWTSGTRPFAGKIFAIDYYDLSDRPSTVIERR